MLKNILITGGAGFIGFHLTDEFFEKENNGEVFDNQNENVPGPGHLCPPNLNNFPELIMSDNWDEYFQNKAPEVMNAVYNFGAIIGAGREIDKIKKNTRVKSTGPLYFLSCSFVKYWRHCFKKAEISLGLIAA